MKDARGHGSNGRGGSFLQSGGLKGVAIAADARFTNTPMRPDRDFKTDADRTVHDLRQRMANTGPGHQRGLMQSIKNLLG